MRKLTNWAVIVALLPLLLQLSQIVCRGYRYEEFPDVSCNCRTAEYGGNCFRCTHRVRARLVQWLYALVFYTLSRPCWHFALRMPLHYLECRFVFFVQGGFGAANPEISCVRCRNALYYDPESTNCVAAEEVGHGYHAEGVLGAKPSRVCLYRSSLESAHAPCC